MLHLKILLITMVSALCIARVEAKPADVSKTSEAKLRYESGLAHFNLQEYKQSIEDFEAAYRLKPDPVFLYNLAQAHRLSENAERALYFYRAYLRSSTNPPNRHEVEGRIETLEKLLAEKQQLAKPPDHTLPPYDGKTPQPTPEPAPIVGPTPTSAPVVVQPVRHADSRTPVYKKWWLWTIVGVAVVGAAVGVGLGVELSAKPTFDAGLGTVGPAALGVRF